MSTEFRAFGKMELLQNVMRKNNANVHLETV